MLSKQRKSELTSGFRFAPLTRSGSNVPWPRGQEGFTLVEVLITLAVVVIVLAVAVPGFGALIAETRMATTTNELISQLNLARSEAVKRSTPVTMCSSSDGSTCSGELDWGPGWMVFSDQERDLTTDDPADIIRVKQQGRGSVELVGNYAYLMYLPDGTLLVY